MIFKHKRGVVDVTLLVLCLYFQIPTGVPGAIDVPTPTLPQSGDLPQLPALPQISDLPVKEEVQPKLVNFIDSQSPMHQTHVGPNQLILQ